MVSCFPASVSGCSDIFLKQVIVPGPAKLTVAREDSGSWEGVSSVLGKAEVGTEGPGDFRKG